MSTAESAGCVMSAPIVIRVTRRKLRRIQREVAAGRRWVRRYARRSATPPLSDLVLVQLMMDAVDHRGRLIGGSYATNLMRPHRYAVAGRAS